MDSYRKITLNTIPGTQVENNKYPRNESRNAKYTLLSFFPLALFFELTKPVNIYFSAMTVLWLIPIVSPYTVEAVLSPYLFIIMVALLREAIEDIYRNIYDRKSNKSRCIQIENGRAKEVYWNELQVGHMILIKKGERIPADTLVLASSDHGNICHMETANLDGEKHPKPRKALEGVHLKIDKEAAFKGDIVQNFHVDFEVSINIYIQQPTVSLYNFDGYYKEIIGNEEQPSPIAVGVKNFLFKEAKLMNTDWVIALVIYTGVETKIQLNGGRAQSKTTKVEKRMFYFMAWLFVVQMFLSVFATILRQVMIMLKFGDFEKYLLKVDPGYQKELWLTFIRYFVFLNTFIPISLVVNIEIVRTIQGLFTGANLELKSKTRDM